jgi:predicted glycoside hydrolase/deacetylase ChbG (UPF0249 family)
MLRGLADGVTELACHPGYASDVDSMYRAERTQELHTLCAPHLRRVLDENDIRLISFAELQPA